MLPDSLWPYPVSSFQYPIQVLDVEPGSSPLETIQINTSWLELLRGCAKQLLLQSTWRTDDPSELALAQKRAFDLIDLLQDQGGGGGVGAAHIMTPYYSTTPWSTTSTSFVNVSTTHAGITFTPELTRAQIIASFVGYFEIGAPAGFYDFSVNGTRLGGAHGIAGQFENVIAQMTVVGIVENLTPGVSTTVNLQFAGQSGVAVRVYPTPITLIVLEI